MAPQLCSCGRIATGQCQGCNAWVCRSHSGDYFGKLFCTRDYRAWEEHDDAVAEQRNQEAYAAWRAELERADPAVMIDTFLSLKRQAGNPGARTIEWVKAARSEGIYRPGRKKMARYPHPGWGIRYDAYLAIDGAAIELRIKRRVQIHRNNRFLTDVMTATIHRPPAREDFLRSLGLIDGANVYASLGHDLVGIEWPANLPALLAPSPVQAWQVAADEGRYKP